MNEIPKNLMNLSVCECEDGSTLFEWIAKDCRFGISLEKELSESSWYFLTKDFKYSECGILSEKALRCLKEKLCPI